MLYLYAPTHAYLQEDFSIHLQRADRVSITPEKGLVSRAPTE